MRLGRTETLILVLIGIGGLFLAYTFFGGRKGDMCGPVVLSSEVKSYIDSKMSGGSSAGQCNELPKLVSKIADLEAKLGSADVFRQNHQQLMEKQSSATQIQQTKRDSAIEVLSQMRDAEIRRIKNEIGNICAGTTSGTNLGRGSSNAYPSFNGNSGGQ